MSLVFISQYIAFAFSIPIAIIACFRAYRHRDHERNMPIVWASLGALLVMIGHASALLAAYFLWTHLITSFTVYTGFLLIYWGLRSLLSKEPPRTTLTGSTIFKVSMVLILIALVLNVGRMLTWIPTDKESSLHYPVELDIWPPWYYEFNLAFYVFHDAIQLMFL